MRIDHGRASAALPACRWYASVSQSVLHLSLIERMACERAGLRFFFCAERTLGMRAARTFLLVVILSTIPLLPAQQQPADVMAALDKIFEPYSSRDTPGGAVAIARNGKIILSRAYGMADLEHGIANSPRTIFEAGSVSKQFTAAAVVLLALQGKLSLDDNVRKYVPEVPDYGTPITLRHLLTHSSGLRDWGSVESIAGWPRTTRVYTHAHVLDIVSRQRVLNFLPGNEHSYCNTGFNLLAIIVSRVSGMPFAEFTKKNLFDPLGMNRTQWRDDYRRIVRGRAIAYATQRQGKGFEMDMPLENVHGNGGLLTTVGDLLIWTENLETGKVGGPAFLEMMHRQGVLNSGQVITYASGLYVTSYRGIPEVSHTGSTAGYRAFLARYPKQHLAVAMLCNVGSITPAEVGHRIADLFLSIPAASKNNAETIRLSEAELSTKAGLYRNTVTGEPLHVVFVQGTLRLQRGASLRPVSSRSFRVGETDRLLSFEPVPDNGRLRIRDIRTGADDVIYEPTVEFSPKPEELSAFAGEYYSPDAETTLTVTVDNGGLQLRRRPDSRIALTPAYRDVFESSLGLIRFIRNVGGRVIQLSVRQDRVYDLRFERVAK
jgi:CubicO group peptidase (beta-lactamase class C family)